MAAILSVEVAHESTGLGLKLRDSSLVFGGFAHFDLSLGP